MPRSISGVTSATVAVIRVQSSTTFAGKGGTNPRFLTNPHKKKTRGVRSGERGGHAIGAALPIHRPVEVLAQLSKAGALAVAVLGTTVPRALNLQCFATL
jgi:hypothetical protein